VTYRLVIRPEADAEVDEAVRWYQKRRQGLGGEFLDAFVEITSRIRQNPNLYPVVYHEARRALLDRFPYSLIYEVHKSEVVILACFHESRDPKEWQRRV